MNVPKIGEHDLQNVNCHLRMLTYIYALGMLGDTFSLLAASPPQHSHPTTTYINLNIRKKEELWMLLLIQLYILIVQSIRFFLPAEKIVKYRFIKTAVEKKLLSVKVISYLLGTRSLQFTKFCSRFYPAQTAWMKSLTRCNTTLHPESLIYPILHQKQSYII